MGIAGVPVNTSYTVTAQIGDMLGVNLDNSVRYAGVPQTTGDILSHSTEASEYYWLYFLSVL